MHSTPQPAVLIVGAGPVGLTLGNDLARRGVAVRVIDRATGPSRHSKALAIFSRTLEELDALNLAEPLLKEGVRLDSAVVHAHGRELARIHFDELPSRFPFVLVLPQSRTEALLEAGLRQAGVEVHWQQELLELAPRDDAVHASVRRADGSMENLTVPYLIACDGAHSTVRHELGLRFAGKTYDETFLLADIAVNGAFDATGLHLHFSRDGVLALVPMGDGEARVIANVPNDDPGSHAAPAEPTIEEIRDLVHARGRADLHVGAPRWLSRFHISRRMVDRMRRGRVFLCGDAAHVHSPAGGQGMNTGMQDAINLGWKLALALRGRAGERLLDSYDAERRPVAAAVLDATDKITRLATLEGGFAQSLRNGVLGLMSGLHPVVETTAERLAELNLGYRNSPLVARHGDASAPVGPGDRAPDAELLRAGTDESRHLHAWLREGRHVLLAFTGFDATERTQLNDVRRRVQDACPDDVRFVPVGADDAVADLPDAWIDVNGSTHALYGAEDGAVVLIRPDGYVGYRGAGLEGEPFEQYWQRNFAAPAVANPHRS